MAEVENGGAQLEDQPFNPKTFAQCRLKAVGPPVSSQLPLSPSFGDARPNDSYERSIWFWVCQVHKSLDHTSDSTESADRRYGAVSPLRFPREKPVATDVQCVAGAKTLTLEIMEVERSG